jgi:hypothetical protein
VALAILVDLLLILLDCVRGEKQPKFHGPLHSAQTVRAGYDPGVL